MFNNIAPKYDLLNRVLSLGIDKIWRRKAIRILSTYNPTRILDVATGTADVAIATARQLKPDSIVGVDISSQMLEVGKVKIKDKAREEGAPLGSDRSSESS